MWLSSPPESQRMRETDFDFEGFLFFIFYFWCSRKKKDDTIAVDARRRWTVAYFQTKLGAMPAY